MDNIGLGWDTEFGTCRITIPAIEWIMLNVKESMYNNNRCYVYNKAFARYFDNNDPYNGKTLAGALSPMDKQECCKEEDVSCECLNPSHFDLIRGWAQTRGLYDGGDPKTQALKLVEEVGETCRAILKQDTKEMIDGIGDCVVVLTNLAELIGTPIEDCIDKAYNEIKGRTGKMNNGTFKKDD
jgi:NTP pyrophosphatase (non-canonical NTP hydrolase)